MRCWPVLITSVLSGLLAMSVSVAQPLAVPPQRGEIVFQTDFETEESRAAFTKNPAAQWIQLEGRGFCLKVTVPPDRASASNMIQMPLDLTRYRGCRLLWECLAKAEEVTKPPASYLGVKFMCHYQSPSQGPFWRNQDNVFGTFDWKKLQFIVPVAEDVTTGYILLGLQSCAGTAYFDDIKITVAKLTPPPRPQPPENPGPVFKGHNLPRLRGVMSPNRFNEEDLRVLGEEWNANVIRWQMTRNWGRPNTDRDLDEYDQWLWGKLEELDKALEACRRYRIKVVVDMHSPPGGRYENSELAIFHEKKYQEHWIALWEQIARRYKGNPVIWGYDLVNEPVQNFPPREEGVLDYLEGQERCAQAIRAIDPNVPIFIEANEWDSPAGFMELQPVRVSNAIYQVHMYVPGQYTHQGVGRNPGEYTPVAYPGLINGTEWNKERLRKVLAPVREFQLAYNVHIFVGEFSAIRWAPGAAQYLRDCIELFEEYGWDWTYHAYREWEGWSLEHGPNREDRQPTKEPTDRKLVVLNWFAQNEKPRFD